MKDMSNVKQNITPCILDRAAVLAVAALAYPLTALADSGAVEYWGDAPSLTDMASFVGAVFNIIIELVNAAAVLIVFYSSAQIYIKIQVGEEGLAKNIAMLIGAVVYFIVMLMVFPAFFAGSVGGHGGLFAWLFG